MTNREVIDKTAEHVREALGGEASGHDWWHVYRVWKSALHIAEGERADMFVVELAALLHDIADYKSHGGDDTVGPRVAREWLEGQGVDEETMAHVCSIVSGASFSSSKWKSGVTTIEGMIVQDADRLDAMGCIGIARTFAYGGNKGRILYDPDIKPQLHESFEQYKNNNGPSVNHFYEKLLLLKDLMNTDTGKAMARKRHDRMEEYLKNFFDEWEGAS